MDHCTKRLFVGFWKAALLAELQAWTSRSCKFLKHRCLVTLRVSAVHEGENSFYILAIFSYCADGEPSYIDMSNEKKEAILTFILFVCSFFNFILFGINSSHLFTFPFFDQGSIDQNSGVKVQKCPLVALLKFTFTWIFMVHFWWLCNWNLAFCTVFTPGPVAFEILKGAEWKP